MNDAKISDHGELDQTNLDLLFVQANKHQPNMDFETFINLIPQIAFR